MLIGICGRKWTCDDVFLSSLSSHSDMCGQSNRSGLSDQKAQLHSPHNQAGWWDSNNRKVRQFRTLDFSRSGIPYRSLARSICLWELERKLCLDYYLERSYSRHLGQTTSLHPSKYWCPNQCKMATLPWEMCSGKSRSPCLGRLCSAQRRASLQPSFQPCRSLF